MTDRPVPAHAGPMTERRWAPQIGLVILGWVSTGLATGWFVFTQRPQDRVFATVVVVALLALSLAGTVSRPRLAAGPDGIAVRGLVRTRRWPWAAVRRLAVVRSRRLGRDVPVLELDVRPLTDPDADELLLVFTRIELGAEPDDVLDALTALRVNHPPE